MCTVNLVELDSNLFSRLSEREIAERVERREDEEEMDAEEWMERCDFDCDSSRLLCVLIMLKAYCIFDW